MGCFAKNCRMGIGGAPSRMVWVGSVMGLVSAVRVDWFVSGESVLYHRKNRDGAGSVITRLGV